LVNKELPNSYSSFYNFENLFDTINDPATNDDEWTQRSAAWTAKNTIKIKFITVLLEIGSVLITSLLLLVPKLRIAVLEDLNNPNSFKGLWHHSF
jgi:hypothetical protein